MILETLFWILETLLWIIAAIVWHEYGHVLFFKESGVQVKIRFSKGRIMIGETKDYSKLTKKEKRNMYFSGIVLGMFPLLIAYHTNPPYFFLIPLYLFGCKKDIRNIWRLWHA